MTSPRLALPLRLPELGPHLGRLVAAGAPAAPGALSLEGERLSLATKVIEAAGEARRAAARDDRPATVLMVGRAVWLSAWEAAVAAVAARVVERINQRLDAAAYEARMPTRLRKRVRLDDAEVRAMTARLGSAGSSLVAALDELESRCEGALRATPQERHELAAWQEALTAAARRLEAAWMALEDQVGRELDRWTRAELDVRRWRRSLWPVWVGAAAALAAAGWLGGVLGGYVASPAWLSALWARW